MIDCSIFIKEYVVYSLLSLPTQYLHICHVNICTCTCPAFFTGTISQTCIGCDSLPTDDDGTFYYCPRSKILVIHCDVNQGGSLVWTAPPLFDSNNRVDFSALDTAPLVETRGFATFFLVSIDVGPGGAQNDFRSTMTFNTEDITDFDEFTIVCQTGTSSASMTLKPLGMAIGLLFLLM